MSEDGLLLNFSTEGPARAATKVQGGRWKDRLKAKKAQIRRDEKANPELKAQRQAKQAPRGPPARPVKRKADSAEDQDRTPKTARPNNTTTEQPEASNATAVKHTREEPAPRTGLNGRPLNVNIQDGSTFVSSLFSSNPQTVQEQEPEEEMAPQVASNAPLKDDTTFEGLGINDSLINILSTKMNIPTPTRIQRASLPPIISTDDDLFIQAQTGSGKTLAYALPIVQRLMEVKHLDRTSGLFALILTPTRELSNQIYAALEILCRACHRIVPGIVIGGEKKKSEKARIRKGVNILVATPGRLADHFDNTESLDLSNIRWIVLDEGDRLMELGFEETITKILTMIGKRSRIKETRSLYPELPRKRVNLLCSATMKDDVKRLEELSLSHAKWITADDVSESSTVLTTHEVPAQLVQNSLIVPAKLRLVTLAAMLKKQISRRPNSRIIVFFSCSDSVDFHFSAFTRGGEAVDGKKKPEPVEDDEGSGSDSEESEAEDKPQGAVTSKTAPLLSDSRTVIHRLHGSLTQQLRTSTLSLFTKKHEDETAILFCTDVASRGLDLPLITEVLEFDPPFAVDDHLHRVGRTARAGKDGTSTIFLLPGKEEAYVEAIKPHHPSGIHSEAFEPVLRDGFGSKWEVDATTWHLNIERWLLEDSAALSLAKRGFTSHVRAYTTHLSSEREIFNIRTLHLGHLAKSFGLREAPGSMKGSHATAKKEKTMKRDMKRTVLDPNKKKLYAAAQAQTGMSEFNIG